MNKNTLANLAALFGAISAGASVVAARVAGTEVEPFTLAFYRYIVAVLCMAPVLYALWPRERLPAGEVSIRYGRFINTIINFLIVAFAIFAVVKLINMTRRKEAALGGPAGPTRSEQLLTEIRDLLARRP